MKNPLSTPCTIKVMSSGAIKEAFAQIAPLFERMAIADVIARKVTQIKGEPVGAAVARGEAAIGFQQMSELLPVSGIDIIGPLPAQIQEVTTFSAGIHVDTKVADAARELMDFFRSPAAQAVIRNKSMAPA